MAMRRIQIEKIVPFKPKKGFRVDIPETLLEGSTNTERERVLSLWHSFQSTAHCICEARHSFLTNKRYRRAVFKTQMSKICLDFSRRTENLKVIFQTTPRPNNDNKENYQLKFLQLTDIPEFARDAPFCCAEIPPTEIQAFGEYVFDRYDTGFRLIVEQILGGGTIEIPTAPIEILEDDTPSGSDRFVDTIYISEGSLEYENAFNPPLALAVLVEGVDPSPGAEEDEDELVMATARFES